MAPICVKDWSEARKIVVSGKNVRNACSPTRYVKPTHSKGKSRVNFRGRTESKKGPKSFGQFLCSSQEITM